MPNSGKDVGSAVVVLFTRQCWFTPDLCADIDGQGGGPAEVSDEARACKLVMGSHTSVFEAPHECMKP